MGLFILGFTLVVYIYYRVVTSKNRLLEVLENINLTDGDIK